MKSTALMIMVIILALIYGAFFFIPPALISPDELSYRFFSGRLAREGTIFYHPEGDRIMGERGFLPRKFHYNVRGEVVSRKPPGLIFVWAGFTRLVGAGFSSALFPLLSAGVLILFYLFSGDIFSDRRLRLASLLLLASMPLFLLRSHAYSPTMLNLIILFSTLLFLRRMLDQGRWYHYLGTGIMAGLLIWVRPTSLLVWLPLGWCLLAERRRLKAAKLIWLGAGCLGMLLLYFIYNKLAFGNFLASGYYVDYLDRGDRSVMGSLKGFFRIMEFHPRIWISHLVSTPYAFSLAFPPLILGITGFYMIFREEYPRRWLYFGGILTAVLVVFFANFETYGFYSREMNLRSSFLRYCLPGLVFLPLGAAFFLSKLKRFFPSALAIAMAFNIIVALFAPLGLLESVLLGNYYRQAGKFILEKTDENSVILSSYWDKLVFPERLVFSDVRGKDEEFLVPLLSRIRARGYQAVYIGHYYDRDSFRPFLREGEEGKISGPVRLHGLLNWIKPPARIYPVEIYRLELTQKARKL